MTICLLLANMEMKPEDQRKLMIWGCILIGVVIVGALFIMLLRRKLNSQEAGPVDDAGFSLSQLRAMRDRGEITPEEYEHTRARVIAKVKAAANAPRPKKGASLSESRGLAGGLGDSVLPPEGSPESPADDSGPAEHR